MIHAERVLSYSGAVAPSSKVTFEGNWMNELKSTMNLTVHADNSVTGPTLRPPDSLHTSH